MIVGTMGNMGYTRFNLILKELFSKKSKYKMGATHSTHVTHTHYRDMVQNENETPPEEDIQ